MLFGSIEAGGTKFVCAVADENLFIHDRVSFPTTTPDETLKEVTKFFNQYKDKLKAIGVGSFGPIDINPSSSTYGYVTSTPKVAWQHFDFLGALKKSYPIPIAWTTDVNAAAYGEYVQGSGKGLSSLVYYTVGTGVGGGAIVKGQFVEGFSHPEMGHMLLRRHPEDSFEGSCIFHKDCLEGLAAGPAIEKRLGKKGQDISPTDSYWDIEAYYIAQCAYNTTLMFSPERIVFGGGVMKKEGMIEKVHKEFKDMLNKYVTTPELNDYIVLPTLGDNAGIVGGLALAKREYEEK